MQEQARLWQPERGNVLVVEDDLHLPNLNGLELLQRLRGHGTPRDCPIIVLGGQDEQADKEKSFRLGATSFLTSQCSRRCSCIRCSW